MNPAKSVLILGARSDIARATGNRFAREGWTVHLAGRRAAELGDSVADLRLRFEGQVTSHEFDVLATDSHRAFADSFDPAPDVVLCCVGLMGDQAQSERDADAAVTVLRSNFEGPAIALEAFASRFLERGNGTIVGVSSVAGERGRASNYVYGAAKAGFTAYLSGMRNRLARKGIQVVTILPGFVNTAMTEGMDLPKALTAQPDEVANAIYTAVSGNRTVVYVRPIWRLIMAIIRLIPERIFMKLNL